MSSLVPLLLLFLIFLVYGEKENAQKIPQTSEEIRSYMQARGFMQIDEIISEKPCFSLHFYITHDSTQKCFTHRCNDSIVMTEFDCKLWNKLKTKTRKISKWTNQLTRRVRNENHASKAKTEKTKIVAKKYKESILEIYSMKADSCTQYSKHQTEKGNLECWRKNCKDEFAVRVQCKFFDGVKPENRHVVYKKRRHHGKI